jgi:hypothetical protein
MRLTPQVTMTLSKAPSAGKNEPTREPTITDLDLIGQRAAIIQETAKTFGGLAFKAYLLKRVLDTACEIAVIAAKAKIK